MRLLKQPLFYAGLLLMWYATGVDLHACVFGAIAASLILAACNNAWPTT